MKYRATKSNLFQHKLHLCTIWVVYSSAELLSPSSGRESNHTNAGHALWRPCWAKSIATVAPRCSQKTIFAKTTSRQTKTPAFGKIQRNVYCGNQHDVNSFEVTDVCLQETSGLSTTLKFLYFTSLFPFSATRSTTVWSQPLMFLLHYIWYMITLVKIYFVDSDY